MSVIEIIQLYYAIIAHFVTFLESIRNLCGLIAVANNFDVEFCYQFYYASESLARQLQLKNFIFIR